MNGKDQKVINNFIIRLSGKAEIPEELSIGHNYEAKISGSITSKTEEDNNDGTSTFIYKFEPVIVEVLKPTGETIKAKDVRRISQRIRSRCYLYWINNKVEQDFEEFYNRIGEKIIINFDEIIGFIQ
jgi:hypothetical protein